MTAKDPVNIEKPVDVEAILPEVFEVEIDGIPVTINRLNLREFLALMKIISVGVGANIQTIDFNGEEGEMTGQMIALLMMAVPEAVEETIQFVKVVVKPVDPADAKQLTAKLQNPEVDVFLDVIAKVIEQEAGELRALLGKATSHFQRIQILMRVTGK